MIKKINMQIDMCIECPYSRLGWDAELSVSYRFCSTTGEEIFIRDIPDWCPLEDALEEVTPNKTGQGL